MMLPDAAIDRVTGSLAFRVSTAAYLIMDCNLHIRAANRAYEEATLQRTADMVGEFMFDVFPDNPDVADANGVEHLEHSLEAVLRHGSQHRMGLQRYDVRDPVSGLFVSKCWLPVNSPIRDADGKTIAILHHVEDVSHLVVPTSLERLMTAAADDGAGEVVDPVAGVRRDATARRQHATVTLKQSQLAVERAARTVSTSESRSLKRALDLSAAPGRALSGIRSR